jgi:hypothetical protein
MVKNIVSTHAPPPPPPRPVLVRQPSPLLLDNTKTLVELENIETLEARPILEISSSPLNNGPINVNNISTSSEIGAVGSEEMESLKRKHMKIVEGLQQNHE